MPPICLHLGFAEEAIARLRHPVIDRNRGSYYLGSTAPDVRFFISASREETHFLSLDSAEGTSGIQSLFDAHPELAGANDISPQTRAFVAGYLSHLVTDEAWIYTVYRPFFGSLSPLSGDPMANLYDRVLQFELDRRERLNSSGIAQIRSDLADSTATVEVGFIDRPSLNKWREFVTAATARQFRWEDFRRFADRYLVWMEQIAPGEVDSFFGTFDSNLEQVMGIVPEERLVEFREQSIAESVRVAGEYLR
ncbi:MAG: hypothetical protein JRS35_22880 [Deltaproteobacteria bacterium]|nr:hypothetical protein [Deltaproteobacteria bacterium]